MFNNQLYNSPYHDVDLSRHSFLITGGAGFIGSNLVEYLLRYNAGCVRVLDNLSNGYFENIKDFISLPNFEFIKGDICDLEICRKAVEGMDYISHQAALGSVPRSISDPINTNSVNIGGFLNILTVSKDSPTLKRMVYAASSSTYGDSPSLPKVEGNEGNPLSPYAVTKLVNELYADVFSRVYGFHTIGLRYFNVFGPKQNPNNPYAAVIPIFCKAYLEGKELVIYGDGETSRDFTFVQNVVQANIKVLLGELNEEILSHQVFNVAGENQITLKTLVNMLDEITRKKVSIIYGPARIGDVKHSMASIEKLRSFCHYEPDITFRRGLEVVLDYYRAYLINNS
jgi:UDP-N-acetylglucosamine 4-epimerase